jgi:xylulokinase
VPHYFAVIDLGTTVLKTSIIDSDGKVKGFVSKILPCLCDRNKHIEQDPRPILKHIFASLKECIECFKINPKNITALSVATQRATVVCTDKNGEAIGNAISWQDMRGTGEIEALSKKIDGKRYYNITGLPNNPVFSLGKILWIKKYSPSLYKQTAKFSLMHDYIMRHMGCGDFFLDWSNASLTGIFDTENFNWSEEILDITSIKKDKLPLLVPSGKIIGTVSKIAARKTGLIQGIPLVAGGGDQQCAGIGAGAVNSGVAEITLGTAGVALCASDKFIKDPGMRITCCAHAVKGMWNLEGLQNSAGASLGWFADITNRGMRFSNDFFRRVSSFSPGAEGVLFYPFLVGASAPYWNPYAKAIFLGLTKTSSKALMVRAVLEGISMETKQVLNVFSEMKIPIKEIRLTGGCSKIDIWNQIQADIYGKKVSALSNPQATSTGVAILAAYGVGVYNSIHSAVGRMVRIRHTYCPRKKYVLRYEKITKKYSDLYSVLNRNNVFENL